MSNRYHTRNSCLDQLPSPGGCAPAPDVDWSTTNPVSVLNSTLLPQVFRALRPASTHLFSWDTWCCGCVHVPSQWVPATRCQSSLLYPCVCIR